MENNKTADKWKKNRINNDNVEEVIPKFSIVRSDEKYGNGRERGYFEARTHPEEKD